MSKESEFLKKVDDKLLQNKVNAYADDIENPPVKKLSIDIPPNPFDAVEEDDEFVNSELTYKQNEKFRRYLNVKGYKDFNEWWWQEGKDSMSDLYSEAIKHNDNIGSREFWEGNRNVILNWWDKWFSDNLPAIKDAILFNKVWGDTIFKNQTSDGLSSSSN